MTDKEHREIIECDCHSEHIMLELDDELDFIYLSIYDMGKCQCNWKEQLRHIWHIITKGSRFSDQIVLNKVEAILLRDTLNKYIEKMKEQNKK